MTHQSYRIERRTTGKAPHIAAYLYVCLHDISGQDVVAADDESSFTFDVEGLSDEALDARPLQ